MESGMLDALARSFRGFQLCSASQHHPAELFGAFHIAVLIFSALRVIREGNGFEGLVSKGRKPVPIKHSSRLYHLLSLGMSFNLFKLANSSLSA